uniref:Uncharacterized protein n=1 Tax=Salmo trutta TaxID=8032 RepID=A0A674BXC1_SALTR
METEGFVNEAIKLKVILNDNRIEKVILPSQPDSPNELMSTLKEKLHRKFDFSLLYEDPDFNNELYNLETIEDLPSPRATVKVLRIRRDTDLGLTRVSASELQDAPPERLGRWPEVFVIPTLSMEVEFALREGNCAYLRHETVLKITRDQKHNILGRMAWTIFNLIMVHEMMKENRDLPLINQHTQKTFALRRKEIVKSSPSVEHLRTRWPALFLEVQLHAEFQRITNQSLQQTFYTALDHHTPRLLTLFREKEGKSTTHVGISQHHEVVGGIPIRPAHVSVVLEDKIVMTNSRSWPDALGVVFGLLYSLHLNYPKALGSTSEFMQKVFLNLDDGKLKPKLLALKNELLA